MGYDCFPLRDKSQRSRSRVLKEQISCEKIAAENFVPVEESRSGRDEQYIACETKKWGTVALVGIGEVMNGDYCIKLMWERSHPYYHKPSREVLDALSPTDNESALSWRKISRENLK